MSLTTRKQQAKALPPTARKAAQQAAQQLAPIAKNARDTTAIKIHHARVWAAPRVEQAAHSVQQNVAPKVSAALEATAHRLEPAPTELKKLGRRARATSREVSARRDMTLAKTAKSGRRWPKMMGGVMFAAATIGAVTAVVMRRNRDKMEHDLDDAALAAAETEGSQSPAADAETGYDDQVRTP